MPTALILSPHFPPSTLAGVHRARHLAKGLPAHGWRPIIMHADPKDYEEPSDPALASLVSSSLEQISVGILSAKMTRAFGVGDIGLRGYFAYAKALRKATMAYNPQVVVLTGSPFYPLLLGKMVRKELGLPVILDFQDPWVSAEGATRRRWTKGWLSHKMAEHLEPRAVRFASAITSVSAIQNDQMRARYPFLRDVPMAAIPIGGDPDDFEALRSFPLKDQTNRLDKGRINLSFVGTFMPRTAPVLGRVFEAVRVFRDQNPILASQLRINFFGTSNQTAPFSGTGKVSLLAASKGVADLVAETPARVPFLDALRILATTDAVLMIGSDEPHYTASKIYPGMMSGRPFISIFHAASSAHAILSRAGGGVAIGFKDPDQLAALHAEIADAVFTIATRPESVGKVDPAAYADYTSHAIARQFIAIFDHLH